MDSCPLRSGRQEAVNGGSEGGLFFDRFAGAPLIIAHRGYRACYPENTLCSFEQSLGRCGMIELDVQLSADGVAVIFHDETLTRTSNAVSLANEMSLTSLAVGDWRFDDLRRLDVGSWFLAADPFGAIRHGKADRALLLACMPQRILTLREVLTWATGHRMPLNIEIKKVHGGRGERSIVSAVVGDIREAGAVDRVVVSSFHHPFLRQCRQMAPEIALAALQEKFHPPELSRYLHSLGVCAYHPENGLVDAALVRTLRSSGLSVNVFTVNDPVRQQELFAFGVTGIFTDFLKDDL
jgi:glycerophosphoryl diester phosphodiesterase